MTWNITLSDKQMSVVCRALENYSRLMMGQIDNALEDFTDLSWSERKSIHDFARKIIFAELGSSNAYYSISSEKIGDNAQISWDILQVLRQAVSWHRVGKKLGEDEREWSTMMGVNFDDPFCCNSHPLCKVERNDG